MTSLEYSSEIILRLTFFIGIFAVFAYLEMIFPRRHLNANKLVRWFSNVGISGLNQILVRIVVPMSGLALATLLEEKNWGLLNQFSLFEWASFVIALLLLDLAIYLQHRLLHVVPIFWRLHRMHHADTDFDVSTGIRFHPLSILLSAFIKLAVIALLGPPILAVLVFEVLLNATSIFNHSNLNLPKRVDAMMRYFVVTPDMHRVHHSTNHAETNSNFGFNFPWWDHLFGTYRDQPVLGHADMIVGLDKFRDERELRIDRLLSQPFRSD